MLKIIRNDNSHNIEDLSNCKYLLYTNEFEVGELYAKIRPNPIFWYIVAKIKRERYRP